MNSTEAAQVKMTNRPMGSWRGSSGAVIVGLTAGVAVGLIVLVPVLILQAARGVAIVPEMQLAASSLMGISAYAGAAGLILGTLLHFFVSIVPAVAYALVAWRVPTVNRWAWIAGPALGIIVFFFMGFVVLPLSAFTTPASVTPMPFLPALLIHMFGLGLPIALFIQRGWARSNDASD
jgi:uncharacterized membrane protein YagU involved in acid resistance